MMLICPSCSTHYEVADTKIPAQGRSVKCASCDHVWTAGPWNRGNYSRTTAFPQRRPAAPREDLHASSSGRSDSSYFSRPVTSVQGNAALAALFDDALPEEESRIVEGEWEAVAEETTPLTSVPDDFSIEARLEAALMANPIARRQLEQGRTIEAPRAAPSPFRKEINRQTTTSGGPDAVPGTAVAIAAPVEAPSEEAAEHASQDTSEATSLTSEAGNALRTLARIGVAAFNRAGDALENLIPKTLFTQQPAEEEPVITPGDRQVSAWREHQRRQARNKMTPMRLAGWTLWAAGVASLVLSLFIFRTELMTGWPETKSLYAALGMPAEKEPVVLKNVRQRFAMSNKGPVIELRGVLQHTGDEPAATPLVQADAYDASGFLLASWVFRTNAPAQMLPSMETPFLTRSLAPAGITRVELTLVPPETALAGRIAPMGEEAAGQKGFFMQKTTGGWAAGQEAVPPPAKE